MDKTTEDRINKICDQANNEIDSQQEFSRKQHKNYLKKIKASRIKNPFRG